MNFPLAKYNFELIENSKYLAFGKALLAKTASTSKIVCN